jgi:hypothetical protein
MLRQPDVLAGLAGAIATVPLFALGLLVLRGPARAAFAGGARVTAAALLGAAVVAAARGGDAPWRGLAAVEALANAVLALACLCAVLPPLTARFGAGRSAQVLAALAGCAVAVRGGLELALHTGLAVRDDAARLTGVVAGIALVCAGTAVLVALLRLSGLPSRRSAVPWLVVAGGTLAVSTAVALACSEHALFPIQLRAPAGSTFVTPGSTAETLLQGLTGIAHSVPRAQLAAVVAALIVGAGLAAWQTRRLAPAAEADTA